MKTATDAKIPVVGFNSGIDDYKESGSLMYFGSDESLAGEEAGKRLSRGGANKHFVRDSGRPGRWRWRSAAPG